MPIAAFGHPRGTALRTTFHRGVFVLVAACSLLIATHIAAQQAATLTTNKSWYEIGEQVTITLQNVSEPELLIGDWDWPTIWRIRDDGSEEAIRERYLVLDHISP